jgi:hypothetical protein
LQSLIFLGLRYGLYKKITQPNTTPRAKLNYFLFNFELLITTVYLDFSQHVSQIILNEFSKKKRLNMPLLSGLGMRQQSILRNQRTRGYFWFESSFQNCFWNGLSTSVLSEICKIRNVWKFPSPFSRNTLISSSENFLGV